MDNSHSYDDLYRLTEAAGSYQGRNQEQRYLLKWQQGRANGNSFVQYFCNSGE